MLDIIVVKAEMQDISDCGKMRRRVRKCGRGTYSSKVREFFIDSFESHV
jgi:hypothetical protein